VCFIALLFSSPPLLEGWKDSELHWIETALSCSQANDKARAILLVLDRSFDIVTPLVHEFTYQAMVYDLIDIQENKYTFGAASFFFVAQQENNVQRR